MKLCPIFLFPSSSPTTIPNPHRVPYGLNTLSLHHPLATSSSTSPSTIMSPPPPVLPEQQRVPRLVPGGWGCRPAGQGAPTAWPAGSQTPQITAGLRLLPLSSSPRKSPAQHFLGSLFSLQMLLFTVSNKITYLRAAVGKTRLYQSSTD